LPLSVVELLRAWRDFYITMGTAAATLIGAMFVVVSIAVGMLTRERSAGAHAYLTSTLVHLGAVVLASLLTMAPLVTWRGFGIVLILGGAIGIAYEAMIAAAVRSFRVDWTDQLWYTAAPLIGYAGIAAAGALGFAASPHAVEVLAAASVLLLVCGIRNAWDMILAFATRERAKK
jgi:hypothetical protein